MVRRIMFRLRPGGGPNSSRNNASRCPWLSLFWSNHADESVNAAPKPTMD